MKLAYDYVIIGSGFGGAIPALRLAQAQRAAGRPVSVCVLERGKRYNMGEFPRRFHRPKEWWWRHEGRRGWKGLIDYHAFENMVVISGSGVGGTSLMYLDVQIDIFDSAFDMMDGGEPKWPDSVNWRAELPVYYRRVEDMLRPRPIPEPVLKTQALRAGAYAAGMGDRFRLLDLAIYWGRNGAEQGVYNPDPYQRGGPPQFSCSNCGECFIGCNTHSKNTLDLNYLHFAEKSGAEVHSQHQVVAIRPNPRSHTVHPHGYTIDYVDLRWGFPGSVSAGTVIVSAGALGSTGLLLRAKHGYRNGRKSVAPTLPDISDRLGTSFSGNGDFGAVAFETNRVINPMEGPTITGVIEFPDRPGGRGLIIEEGGFPDLLRANLRQFPGGLASGRRLLRLLKNVFGKAKGQQLTESIFQQLDFEAVRDALPYLVMGTDAADGVIALNEDGGITIRWPHAKSMELWRDIEQTLRAVTENPAGLDGNLMLNPTWSAQKRLLTVHPLGGCPLGKDASHGVVSPDGDVFNYPNLYVSDGSILPAAIGPNPSKTIGALAERISDKIISQSIGQTPSSSGRLS